MLDVLCNNSLLSSEYIIIVVAIVIIYINYLYKTD